MGSKTFKKGMDSLLDGAKDSTKKRGRGRPRVNVREITKTSQAGTKAGETRATFIMSEEQLEDVKAFAYHNHVSIKTILSKSIDEFFVKRKSELIKSRNAYKNKGKEQF